VCLRYAGDELEKKIGLLISPELAAVLNPPVSTSDVVVSQDQHPTSSTEHEADEIEDDSNETHGRPTNADVFKTVIELINTGQYNQSAEMEELCSAIGRSFQLIIYKDSQTLHTNCKDL
jgi:hypothetical protein